MVLCAPATTSQAVKDEGRAVLGDRRSPDQRGDDYLSSGKVGIEGVHLSTGGASTWIWPGIK